MIQSFCDLLRKELKTEIDRLRDALEDGKGVDATTRGELRMCRRVMQVVDELEERARRAES